MDTFILPPSTNWQLSNILACNDNGLLAYGSKGEICLINLKEDGAFSVSFLNLAHKEKVNVVVFSPIKGKFSNCLATCGDDGMVRVWDFIELRLLVCHSGHKEGVRVMGLDWSRADTNRLVSVNDLGSIVCWDLASNTIRKLHCGIKILPLCLACCPHDKDLIAIGCKGGVTLVIDIKGSGKIVHRLRGNEQDVISISWCPVPYNVIKYKKNVIGPAAENDCNEIEKDRDLLLATGGLEKSVFIWRTGSDGRFEIVLNLPNNSLSNTSQRKRSFHGSNNVLWTCVLWVDAYTLLSTSQFAELVAWDLNNIIVKSGKKPQPRLLHARHHKGCFSIACPVIYDIKSDWKETRTVWTTAMDKRLVATSLASGTITRDIPTLGGIVFCMAISPLDPNRLAIGISDSKLFVWNTSNINSLNLETYWKKIIGKVMAVSWHPTEEDILAYGTNDGHIGLLELGASKPPTLLRLHIRKAVYRICWAPPILKSDNATCDSKLVLYAVGDGDILQFNANLKEPDEEPKSMNSALLNSFDKSLGLQKTSVRCDIAFKPDNTCFAVASENGSVYLISCETLKLKHALYPHKKLINYLVWHSATVACDNNLSPYQHWLATSSDNIKVYNIPPESQPELVASLNGHSEKVVSLAWSPHFHGRLLSASYDCTVQVWDVPKQTCLAICQDHASVVLCALFSPQDPDVVISGSSDSTVRFWHISNMPTSSAKPERKKSRVEIALKVRSDVAEATELTVDEEGTTTKKHGKHKGSPNTSVQSNSSSHVLLGYEKGSEDSKKRQKGRTMFPVTNSSLTQARHFEVFVDRWARDSASGPSTFCSDNTASPSASDLGYLDFFGDDKAMNRLLLVEESRHILSKQFLLAQQTALWRGDVTQMIQEAITKKQLTDWLISITPLAGFELWEKACEKYAEQLAECGEVTKASSYLLTIHKTHEAVQLLLDHKFHREAIAIAKCRLAPDDPLTCTAYNEWGNAAKLLGQTTLSAHCFLAAGNLQACVEVLIRIKELRWLRLAAQIARRAGQTEQADSLALECLSLSITTCNFPVAHQLLAESPQYQYWSIWLRASELLVKIKNRSENELFEWLEGRQPGQFNMISELSAACTSAGPAYNQLLPHLPTNKEPEFERDMWSYMSGQFTAACAAKQEATTALFLHHVVSALSSAFHFQTNHPASLALPLTLSLLAPNGLFSGDSILETKCETPEEKLLMKSLKAFACASIILWMNNNWEKVKNLGKKNETEPDCEDVIKGNKEYKMMWLPEMLVSCSVYMLDSENVVFFVKKAQRQQLQNLVNEENIQSKCVRNKMENGNKNNKLCSKTVIVMTDNHVENAVTNTCRSPSEGRTDSENLNVAKQTISKLESGQENKNDSLKNVDTKKANGSSDDPAIINDGTNAIADSVALNEENETSKGCNKNNNMSLKCNESETKSVCVQSDNLHSVAPQNGSVSENTSEEDSKLKLNQIRELDEYLQKFEGDRVSVPNPFTAYINIKYLLDNLVSKQDAKLAQNIQETCDKLWKKSQQ